MDKDILYKCVEIITAYFRERMCKLLIDIGANDVIVNMDATFNWSLKIASGSSFLQTFRYIFGSRAINIGSYYIVYFDDDSQLEIYTMLEDSVKRNVILQKECSLMVNILNKQSN